MTDSVFVFAPGERITDDSTGAPISGGTAYFYDAQTSTPKTVYGDAALSASLGTSIITDSLGYPTSDGTTRTLIYVGTSPYKIVIKDADGNTIATHDDIPGAVVSASSANISVMATFPIVTKSLNYTVVSADQNTTFAVNCSSASVTLTLPSATDNDIPNGWKIKVQHAGSANQAIIVVKSGSGQSINEGTKTYGGASFVLRRNGEDCEITADGGNWRISSHTPPFIKAGHGIVPVVSRLATSPGSPTAGDIYLLTGTGGSWSTFTAGDLALYTGAGWTNFTPPSNCGWRAWVQGESLYYSYISSAWVPESATDSFGGTQANAVQSDQETGTSTTKTVTPGRQKYHPGHPKAWGSASGDGTTLLSSFGMSSITDVGTGTLACNFATSFSSGNYSLQTMVLYSQASCPRFDGQASSSAQTRHADTSNTLRDPTTWYWSALGDLP